MKFKIDHLDHVAITVKDRQRAIQWYEAVLGLKKYEVDEWGEWPVFMMAGTTGVALFPEHNSIPPDQHPIEIDHFAFSVQPGELLRARKEFDDQGINYVFKDHTHYHSLYLTDPDDHTVELTALVNTSFFD